jgi:hypothetical protein
MGGFKQSGNDFLNLLKAEKEKTSSINSNSLRFLLLDEAIYRV